MSLSLYRKYLLRIHQLSLFLSPGILEVLLHFEGEDLWLRVLGRDRLEMPLLDRLNLEAELEPLLLFYGQLQSLEPRLLFFFPFLLLSQHKNEGEVGLLTGTSHAKLLQLLFLFILLCFHLFILCLFLTLLFIFLYPLQMNFKRWFKSFTCVEYVFLGLCLHYKLLQWIEMDGLLDKFRLIFEGDGWSPNGTSFRQIQLISHSVCNLRQRVFYFLVDALIELYLL